MRVDSYLVLAIDAIARTNPAGRTASRAIVAPACTSLPVGTIPSHVASVAADTADDAGSKVLSLGTVVLAVADLAAVLAGLVLVVSQGSVQGGEFAQLVSLEFVLALGDRRGLQHLVSARRDEGKRGVLPSR